MYVVSAASPRHLKISQINQKHYQNENQKY